jgi:hypothetical protein
MDLEQLDLERLFRDVNKPVALLQKLDPSVLAALRDEFPNHVELLNARGGPTLGAGGALSEEDALFTAKAWAVSLQKSAQTAKRIIPGIRRTLQRADLIEVSVEIAAAISGSTLFGLIVGTDGSKFEKIAAATVTVVCTSGAVISRFLRRSVGGASRQELLQKLVTSSVVAEILAQQLMIWTRRKPPRAPLDPELLTRAYKTVEDLMVTTTWR